MLRRAWLSVTLSLVCIARPCDASPAEPLPEEVLYASYYLPDAVEYAGTICAYVKNTTAAPMVVREITLDGKSVGKVSPSDRSFLEAGVRDEYIRVADDRLAWYRVYPNPVPPGGIAEILLRLVPAASRLERYELGIAVTGRRPLKAAVALSPPAFTLEYVGLSRDLDEVHVYLRGQPGGGGSAWQVEIDGERASGDVLPVRDDYHYAKVKLARRWVPGSFHAVAAGTRQQRRAVLLRALPAPPPLAIMGNLSEREAEQYATHLFDAHIAFTAGKAKSYDTLEKFGLGGAYIYSRKLKPDEPKYEAVYYDQPQIFDEIKGRRSLWAYFLEDEPDGRYHHTRLSSAAISRDVERANQFCRIMDPRHPTYLQIDHGGYPRNLYLYGQIPDYVCTHAYATGTEKVIDATLDHVRNTQAASRPRPFYYLNCGYCQRKEGRTLDPDEMRLEIYSALAQGAKSLQWYPAHGAKGLLAHPAMWNAVGETNGVLHQVLPLTSLGMPVDQPRVDNEKVLGSCILCGDKAMVVVLVNRDFEVTPDKFSLKPVEKVNVTVRLPSFLRAIGVATVGFPAGIADKPAEIDRSRVRFSTRLQSGAVLVIYTDQSLFDQLREIHAACQARYKPMPMQHH